MLSANPPPPTVKYPSIAQWPPNPWLQVAFPLLLLHISRFTCDRNEPDSASCFVLQPPRSRRFMTQSTAAETGSVPGSQTIDQTAGMKPTMAETDTTKKAPSTKGNSQAAPASKMGNATGSHSSPKKRRKVNHGRLHALWQGCWSRAQVKSTLLTHMCSMRLLSAIGKPVLSGLESPYFHCLSIDILSIHPST